MASKSELKSVGCCELISEISQMVEELTARSPEEFDLVDPHRLIKIQRDLALLVDKLFENIPHDCYICEAP